MKDFSCPQLWKSIFSAAICFVQQTRGSCWASYSQSCDWSSPQDISDILHFQNYILNIPQKELLHNLFRKRLTYINVPNLVLLKAQNTFDSSVRPSVCLSQKQSEVPKTKFGPSCFGMSSIKIQNSKKYTCCHQRNFVKTMISVFSLGRWRHRLKKTPPSENRKKCP